eukprot:8726299-Heterocapsa_arctica.AAC.1
MGEQKGTVGARIFAAVRAGSRVASRLVCPTVAPISPGCPAQEPASPSSRRLDLRGTTTSQASPWRRM